MASDQAFAADAPTDQYKHAYPTLSLADARQKAQEALRDTQLGIEPEPQKPTLGDVVPQFVDLYAKPRNRGWRTQERLLMYHCV